ncbi:MAG TPA: hypothetical protein GX708_23265 [Gallicola sp.]|nr:hypothetical protein [Gallicola sp.]
MKLTIITIITLTLISCEKDYTCECKYLNETKTHTVEAKDKYTAIGKCHSQDSKCRLKR